MDGISSLLADYLLRNNAIEEEDYEIYKYGLLSGAEMLVCVATCYIIAAQMGMLLKCTLLLAILFLLRSYVGGLHLNSYKACYICSCVVVVFTLLAVKNLPIPKFYSLLISILEIMAILFLKPVENMNRPVNDNEKLVFLNRIKIILFIIFLLTIFCYILNLNSYLDTITYTLSIIFFSMLLGMLKHKIEQKEE